MMITRMKSMKMMMMMMMTRMLLLMKMLTLSQSARQSCNHFNVL